MNTRIIAERWWQFPAAAAATVAESGRLEGGSREAYESECLRTSAAVPYTSRVQIADTNAVVTMTAVYRGSGGGSGGGERATQAGR